MVGFLISLLHNSNYWTTIHTQTIGQSYLVGAITPYRIIGFYQSNSTVDGFSIYMSGYTFSGQLAFIWDNKIMQVNLQK